MLKPKFIMMCGLPASGKSTKAKEIADDENALILSSDEMRIELFGDVNHQDDNGKLFEELYRRAKEYLKQGKSVIVDATNISSKRRISTLNEFKNYHKEIYYLCTYYEKCLYHDIIRDKKVGEHVINRMYRTLLIPTYKEGWNDIHIYSNEFGLLKKYKDKFENIIFNPATTHDGMFEELSKYDSFTFLPIYNLPHDSKWHTLSVSRHTYEVWKYIMDNYHAPDKDKMLMVALFHDTGKAHCKQFKEGSKYANFYNHENVSAQLVCNFLMWMGYEEDFILDVSELVQLHMRLLSADDSESCMEKLKQFVGEDTFNKLKFFKEADEQAK
jgi:predicted kinase